jgi:hypothetical protein
VKAKQQIVKQAKASTQHTSQEKDNDDDNNDTRRATASTDRRPNESLQKKYYYLWKSRDIMHIKEIVVDGFKSYAHRTVIAG